VDVDDLGRDHSAPVHRVAGSGPGTHADLIEHAADLPAVRSEVALSDDAVILYTSGTTGQPKGAVLTHANLTFNTMNQLAHVDVLSTDTALCMCPLFHATGLGQVSLPTFFKGGTVVIVPKFDAGVVLSAIADLQIASCSAVPTMLQMLCDHDEFVNTDLSSLRFAVYGGSMVAERVALAWQSRGVHILQGYGMTEASPGVYLATPDGAMERPVSIGLPHFFTDVELAPVAGQDPSDGSGELLVRGPNVFRGYWNRPADTDAAFDDGWFRSGDVVQVGEDGWSYVVDRIKDMIISGGENIYPAEVEGSINALPGIVDSAVIAISDAQWGEVGLAFVISTTAWTEASLRAALAAHLAAFKIPKQVRFVDELPRTATGKVRKQELRTTMNEEMDREHNQHRVDTFADATDDHQWIHTDPERAKDGPFGGTVAHGYLTLSLLIPLWTEILDVRQVSTKVNYGLDKVRFPAPVPVGSKVRATATLADISPSTAAPRSRSTPSSNATAVTSPSASPSRSSASTAESST
jgi:acyl-CoA synthetase (AMP-forming)/AMP-acid ligase II